MTVQLPAVLQKFAVVLMRKPGEDMPVFISRSITVGSRGWLYVGECKFPAQVMDVTCEGDLKLTYVTVDCKDGAPLIQAPQRLTSTFSAQQFDVVD